MFTLDNSFWLAIANFFTSAFTAITGVGGGMILIGLMPLFLPYQIIIPLHGATQLSSNASRAWFGRHHILWQPTFQFAIGSFIGAIVIGWAVQKISLSFLPLIIGIYILLMLWLPSFSRLMQRFNNFYLIGLIQTGLGLFVGAPGPLAIAVLHKYTSKHQQVVATGAMMMTLVHSLKVIVYILLGAHFNQYWLLLILMIIAAIIGSFVGTRCQQYLNPIKLKSLLRWLLTLLALHLVWRHISNLNF